MSEFDDEQLNACSAEAEVKTHLLRLAKDANNLNKDDTQFVSKVIFDAVLQSAPALNSP